MKHEVGRYSGESFVARHRIQRPLHFGMALHEGSNLKEGGRRVVFSEDFQQGRGSRAGAVVKSEGDRLAARVAPPN